MTQLIRDRFAKEYLTALLSTIGTVHVHRCVNSKDGEINQEKPATELIRDRFAKQLLKDWNETDSSKMKSLAPI